MWSVSVPSLRRSFVIFPLCYNICLTAKIMKDHVYPLLHPSHNQIPNAWVCKWLPLCILLNEDIYACNLEAISVPAFRNNHWGKHWGLVRYLGLLWPRQCLTDNFLTLRQTKVCITVEWTSVTVLNALRISVSLTYLLYWKLMFMTECPWSVGLIQVFWAPFHLNDQSSGIFSSLFLGFRALLWHRNHCITHVFINYTGVHCLSHKYISASGPTNTLHCQFWCCPLMHKLNLF